MLLREKGHEYGATTGRKRRCGWLDLVALKYAVECNGITDILITKLDVLAGMDTISLCCAYRVGGQEVFFDNSMRYEDIRPVWKHMKGWGKGENYRQADKWSVPLRNFIEYIEIFTGVRIAGISYGVHRNEILWR